jgi:prepilin-type processing-associated H-X9-DG protein
MVSPKLPDVDISMRKLIHRVCRFRAITCMALLSAVGCGHSGKLPTPVESQLRALSAVYLDFAAATGKGPANEKQLLAHIRNVPQFLLADAGITAGASRTALVSQRDGQPLVIRYGIGICQQKKSAPMIACEKNGQDGKRYAAFADGHVDCVDEAAAKELTNEHH